MNESVNSVLESLGGTAATYQLAESITEDADLERKFLALEALSELDRPKTVKALREILRIFID